MKNLSLINIDWHVPLLRGVRSVLFGLFFFTNITIHAQKEDYNWIFGSDYTSNGRNVFKFDNDDFIIDTATSNMTFFVSNSSISDSLGNLLFYTNGLKIYNGQTHQIIENGDSINYTDNLWIWIDTTFQNYRLNQSTLILPSTTDVNKKLLFSLRADTIIDNLNFYDKFATNLIVTTIKNEGSNLKVINKNTLVLSDTLITGCLSSCKHANGRDWWIVTQEALTNCLNVILYNPDTIYLHHKYCAGIDYLNYDVGYLKFSKDGSKLCTATSLKGIKVFDFDRCSGELNMIEYISRDEIMDSADWIGYYFGNFEISPNSKYLFTGPIDSLFRFDLAATNILQTKELVAWVHQDSLPFYGFDYMQLAPDGKIYFSNGAFKKYHVLHNPNDDNVNNLDLELKIPLPKNGSNSMGSFPNYRLGRLIGSPCDTLYDDTTGINELTELKVLEANPNPAHNKIRIEYAGKFWEQVNNLHLKITNTLGQTYYNKKLPEYSAWQIIDLKEYPKGVYFVYLVDDEKILGTLKFIKK